MTRRSVGRAARALVLLGAAGLLTVAVLAELGDRWWVADLFAHFRFHYLAIGAVLLAAALLLRARLVALAVLAACAPHLWALFAFPTAPVAGARAMAANAAGNRLRVVSVNFLFDNGRKSAMARFLKRIDADIVCAQEADAPWRRMLAGLRGVYPHQSVAVDGPEMVLSKHPIVEATRRFPHETLARTDDPPPDFRGLTARYSYLAASVHTPAGTVRVLCVHPPYGLRESLARRQDLHFAAYAVEARSSRMPVILMGDLNLTAYSPRFRTLLAKSDLRAADHGPWWPRTWPTPSPHAWTPRYIRGLAIDHVLVGRGLRLVMLRRGPDVGSDHFPLIADLRVDARDRRPAMAR